jgi:hypothetical protein
LHWLISLSKNILKATIYTGWFWRSYRHLRI